MSTEGERHLKFLSYLLPIDMLLSAVFVLVVAQPSSEFPEGLMNYPVLRGVSLKSSRVILLFSVYFYNVRFKNSLL